MGKRRGKAPRRVQERVVNPYRGHVFTPSELPPMRVVAPWYHLVIPFEDEYQEGTSYLLNPGTIRARICNLFSLQVNSVPNLVFKLRSIQIWAVADAQSQSVSVSADVSSLSCTISDDVAPTAPRAVYYGTVAKLVSTGTLNKPAAVGYKWSLADQNVIISPDQKFNIVSYSSGGNGYLRIQINAMFSFCGVAPPV